MNNRVALLGGGADRRVLLWDPDRPQTPVELGRHDGTVWAVAVTRDGRVVSGGYDRRVLLWDVTMRTEVAQVGCSVTALATGSFGPCETSLVVAHRGAGLSLWSVTRGSQELLPSVS